jgi:hypothetical protein
VGPGALDLSGAEDELYAASPEEFIARRKDLVAQARAAKDRTLATQIGQLRRPTRSAWLLNLLARAEPDQVEELLGVGAALADAQRRRSGADLRRLSKDRRAAIDAATGRAVAAGVEHGHTAADATVTEVAQTLTAALADPQVAEDLRRGRLSQAASYGGFGPDALSDALTAMTASAAEPTDPEPEVGEPEQTGPAAEPTAEERAAAEREATLATQRGVVDTARQAAADADTAADEATTEADALADRVEELKAELADATTAAEAAQAEARQRRRRAAELRQAAEAAAQALAEAEGG